MSVDFDIVGASVAITGFLSFIYYKVIKPRQIFINTALKTQSEIVDTLSRIENGLIQVSQKQHVYLLEHELGIYETDIHGNCLLVNRTYCRIADKTESECMGSGWILNIHYEDRDRVAEEWERSIEGERDFKMNYRIMQPRGKVIHVFGSAHPMKNPYTGKLFGYLGTVKVIQ